MRKGAGISALSRHTTTSSSYSTLSSNLITTQLTNLQSSLETFRQSLQQFATLHRDDIRKDPAFRHQFQKMCAAIGVDPLAVSRGSSNGFWQELLGLGEWQYGLAVQVVDICVSTRDLNGGIIEMQDLLGRIKRLGGGGHVSEEDVINSLDLLKPLQEYTLLKTPGLTYIRSIPRELDTDQSTLLALAAGSGGRLNQGLVQSRTGWGDQRVRICLDDCVMREGLGWVDGQNGDVWVIAAVEFEG